MWVAAIVALAWIAIDARRIRIVPAERAPLASPLRLAEADGSPVDLERYRGDVVVVNLWASWCGACVSELPALARLHDRYADRGLVVLGANLDDPPERYGELGRSLGIPYPIVAATGPFEGSFRTGGTIPHSWLIDRAGRVRVSHSGIASAAALDRAARTLLDE